MPWDSNSLRIAEAYVNSYAVGDIWLIRGSEMDVAVDTGSGIVPAGPIVETIADDRTDRRTVG